MTITTTAQRRAVEEFMAAALRGDPEGARRLGLAEADRSGPLATVDVLLVPALRVAGDRWLVGDLPADGEHRVTAAVDAVLQELGLRVPVPTAGPTVAVSTGDGDWHATGARLADLRLRTTGWRPVPVGPSLAPSRLDELLRLHALDAVALSCATPSHLAGVGRTVLAVHARGLPVVVGGAAFDDAPHRVARVGADAGPGSLPTTGAGARSWVDQVRTIGLARPSADAHAAFELDRAALLESVVDALRPDGPYGSRQLQQDVVVTTVDTWISAVAVDEPELVRVQLDWVGTYLAARSHPAELLAELAGALRQHVVLDPGDHLARVATG